MHAYAKHADGYGTSSTALRGTSFVVGPKAMYAIFIRWPTVTKGICKTRVHTRNATFTKTRVYAHASMHAHACNVKVTFTHE